MTGFFSKKKVRFSRTSTMHQAKTPRLVAGSLSPASSAGPLTPPDMYVGLPGPTPYGYYPSAPYHGHVAQKYPSPPIAYYPGPPPMVPSSSNTSSSSTRVSLHPYLEIGSRHPPIQLDLLDPPSMASRHGHHVSSSALAGAATTPPTHTLTIRSPYLPWTFVIVASNRSYVTLYDVLDQLYTQLRINITKSDYEKWSSSERARATKSYEHRYRRCKSQEKYQHEKSGGMRRIDFLMERTKFLGLSKSKRGDTWTLNTG